jgi:hydrogenase expression/formation protein HypD
VSSFNEEFAKSEPAATLRAQINEIVTRPWTIMEMCGLHTHTILEYGIDQLLPESVQLLHGPGCAICITPLEVIDRAFAIALKPDVIFCCYPELLRVPGTRCDLLEAKATGADVRVVYSPMDSVNIAQENPDKKIVFFAVGSDNAVSLNAKSVKIAAELGLKNYCILSSQAHTPPICSAVLARQEAKVHGLLGPGDGCSIIGCKDFESISREFNMPVVITGLEPLDVLEGLYRCLLQLETGKHSLENQYTRAVTRAGNAERLHLINDVFQPADFEWRRIGVISNSGYMLKPEFSMFNAWQAFEVEQHPVREAPVCISDQIMFGLKKPGDCPAFGKSCSPQHPIGATMVSTEGTCALYHKFRWNEPQPQQQN